MFCFAGVADVGGLFTEDGPWLYVCHWSAIKFVIGNIGKAAGGLSSSPFSRFRVSFFIDFLCVIISEHRIEVGPCKDNAPVRLEFSAFFFISFKYMLNGTE